MIGTSAPPKFQHMILTRFNVRYNLDSAAAPLGRDLSWLADRFTLFERYCLPSVLAQTEQNFIWFVFFDGETPEPYLSKARALGNLAPNILPRFCDTLPLGEVLDTIRTALNPNTEWLLTTRLDNDDGLHRDFVKTAQNAQSFARAEILNCRRGFIVSESRGYLRRDDSNAFISMSEPLPEIKSISGIGPHVYVGKAYPIRQITETPMWLQVVHAKNLTNRVRGWRIPIAVVAKEFPAVRPGVGQVRDGSLNILFENLTLGTFRALRDGLVMLIRKLAGSVGFDFRRKIQLTAPSRQAQNASDVPPGEREILVRDRQR